ncbi:hypothetical protein ACFQ1M_13905 [Sungkyunkwania multivorans]|uniref:Lipocalin-like domain-containing protein n=1 Tax=Sungkyunkwania multivorans TaxID=1173618 RepID=A0ABW3D028_9FLAO
MKKLVVTFLFILPALVFSQSLATIGKELKLVGDWELTDIDYGRAMDLNKDGVASKNALKEFDSCKKHYFSFDGQYTGVLKIGDVDCASSLIADDLVWTIKKTTPQEIEAELDELFYIDTSNDKSEVKKKKRKNKRFFLVISSEKEILDVGYEILKLDKTEMQLVMVSTDGYDSTLPVICTFIKTD